MGPYLGIEKTVSIPKLDINRTRSANSSGDDKDPVESKAHFAKDKHRMALTGCLFHFGSLFIRPYGIMTVQTRAADVAMWIQLEYNVDDALLMVVLIKTHELTQTVVLIMTMLTTRTNVQRR